MIIDCHTQIWPDKNAEKTKKRLEKIYEHEFIAVPTLDNLRHSMDKNGIDISIASSFAEKPDQVAVLNTWLFSIKDPKVRVMAAFHPYMDKWEDELKRIRDNAVGVRLDPQFHDYYVDDQKVYRIYERLQEYGLPVLFNAGEVYAPRRHQHCIPQHLDRIYDEFPGLKMIAAHMGGFKMWDDARQFLAGKDIYFDTSLSFRYLEQDKLDMLLATHSENRVLFGTAFPLADPIKDIDYMSSLPLDFLVKNKIFSANAQALFSLE